MENSNDARYQASGSDERFIGESMLRRIANFGVDKDPNQTKHWIPDSAGNECYHCQDKFTTFRRRHHCRICGLIFCNRCCSFEPQAKLAGFTETNIRLCAYCASKLAKSSKDNVTTTSTNLPYISTSSQIDQQGHNNLLQASMRDSSSNISDTKLNTDHFSLSKPSSDFLSNDVDAEQSSALNESSSNDTDTEGKAAVINNVQQRTKPNFNLKSLFSDMFRTPQGLTMRKERRLFRTTECVQGKELIDWLIKNQRATLLSEAKLFCQCFVNENYIEPVNQPTTTFVEFKCDDTLYKFGKRGLDRDKPGNAQVSFRAGSVASMTSNDSTNLDNNSQQPTIQSEAVTIVNSIDNAQCSFQTVNSTNNETSSISSKKENVDFNLLMDGQEQENEDISVGKQTSPMDDINALYTEYTELLLKQMLVQYHVDHEWLPIILNTCQKLVDLLRIQSMSSNTLMNNDIRRIVKFKKISGGSKTETEIIHGCVFTKNVVHRQMSVNLDCPQILLLKSQIEYQRHDDHRFTTLEPVISQESHFLKSCVEKINAHFKPNILVVEKSVSRIAQDFLIDSGLVLIYNVKESIMQRLAKCLNTTILDSIDSRLPTQTRSSLGFCESFYVKEFQLENGCTKRLMFFSGCPPQYGCTVLIRGGTQSQLSVVKAIMRWFLLFSYSSKLERSFLNDCHARMTLDQTDGLASQRSFELENFIETAVNNKQSTIDLIQQRLILSTTPYVRYSLPYTLSCTDQQYPANEAIYQSIFNPKYTQHKENGSNCLNDDKSTKDSSNSLSWFYNAPYNSEIMHVNDRHKFITDQHLIPGIHQENKENYAHFRAAGGRCNFRRRRWYDWLLNHQKQSKDRSLETIFSPHLDLCLHLNIAILYSAQCTVQDKLLTCHPPEIIEMPAYSEHDTTLGSFLEQHCFSTSDAPCKTCQQPLQDHVRQIVHGDMKLIIRIKHIEKSMGSTQKSSRKGGIYMSSYCEYCRELSAKRSMSAETWSLSFTKYLELLFHLESFGVYSNRGCQHHLFRDRYHYFHTQQFVATFRLYKIQLKRFILPTPSITLTPLILERQTYIELTKSLSEKGYDIFTKIVEILAGYKQSTMLPDYIIQKIEQFSNQERSEQQRFRTIMDEIQLKMTGGIDNENRQPLDTMSYMIVDNQLVEAKKFITKVVQSWNIMLPELDQLVKKSEKQQREILKKIPVRSVPTGENLTETNSFVQSEIDVSSNTDTIVSLENEEHLNDNRLKSGLISNEEDLRRPAVLKFFSTLLQNNENESNPLKCPFPDEEHLELNGKYIVNHRELSSIIAHALSSSEYETRLKEELNSFSNDVQSKEKQETRSNENENENQIDDHRHIDLNFQDSSTKFVVQVSYAAHFHLLRQIILGNQAEEQYVRSLSRCNRWQPHGGKSKSVFWHTSDKFFILKDLNQRESLSFSNFAPYYIEYMSNALNNRQPTNLAKIFGVYKIQYKSSSGENMKCDVLVLENLLHNEQSLDLNFKPPKVYDLKGSMRNRFVTPDETQSHSVFLDENFKSQTQENPFYVRLQTGWTLMKAIDSDTLFLAKHGIVDYSLLIICYENENQSIVRTGIIDYIRTYTWDKKLETLVKSMRSQAQPPTVISPEQYRLRFLRQMNQYFPVVPDEWYAHEKKFFNMKSFQREDSFAQNSGSNEMANQ